MLSLSYRLIASVIGIFQHRLSKKFPAELGKALWRPSHLQHHKIIFAIFNAPRMAPHAKSSRGAPKVLKQGKTQIRQQKRKREQEGVQQLEARVKELVRCGGVKKC